MVDREKVIKGLECHFEAESKAQSMNICGECPYNEENSYGTCYFPLLNDALELLKEQKLVTDINVPNKWISVKDKKRPLLGTLVIVCLQDEKTQRVRMSYYDKYKGVEIWSDVPVGFEVTHWMPLPEPPKEK